MKYLIFGGYCVSCTSFERNITFLILKILFNQRHCNIEANRGAGTQHKCMAVNATRCGFRPHLRKLNIY